MCSTSADEIAELGEEQALVLTEVIRGNSVLMHGTAGTGKSMVITRLIQMLCRRKRSFALTAFTGAAAVHIGGSTIHSFFTGMGLMCDDIDVLIKKLRRSPQLKNKIKSLSIFIIDEISMVSAVFFSVIDKLFRFATGKDVPFGGVQLLLCGDFYQLPPVDSSEDGLVYAFETEVWNELNLIVVEPTKVYRQVDEEFIDILNEIRTGDVTINAMAALCKCVGKKFEEDEVKATTLFARNVDADRVNDHELGLLSDAVRTYDAECVVLPKPKITEAEMKELYKNSKSAMKHCPAPNTLNIKRGAQVMLRRNLNVASGLANGSRGCVIGYDMNNKFPVVRFTNGSIITIQEHRFEYKFATGSVTVTQVPLMLAWAMTIHKSQGCTVDRLVMSMDGIRTDGQAYVALSRVRSLEGLSLTDFNPRAIRASSKVKAKFPGQKKNSEQTMDDGERVTGKKRKSSN
jgi:ATP-dependent DNA helicase PIF1